ncbi:MAG: CPBP family intramembrane glutamic endopeptidase [Candidatus Limnocylindrales bacterium]
MPEFDLAGLPGIGDVPDELRILMTIGLAGLLVILRFDAERFSAAEYDDIDRWGRKPSLLRRLAWYTLGIGLILVVLKVHPSPQVDLFLSLGDRLGAIILGLAYGAVGTAIAMGLAFYRYHYLRFPGVTSYPGAVINAIATAFVDEAVFRGMIFGFMLMTPIDPNLANVAQALLYALATRLGAPGRPWYMLATVLAIGLAGGWLTGITGGIGAAFLGHAITRVAIFLTTGHSGLPKARGTEDEEVERRQGTPEGWRVLGPREASRDR